MEKDSYRDFCERNGISEETAAAAFKAWLRSQNNLRYSEDQFLKFCRENCEWEGEYGKNEMQIASYIRAWASTSPPEA